MKLTTFILLISLMQVSAATFGQRVTLKQNNLTIDKVFREIRKQTGYDVLMGYGDFKASKINANFDNASLTEVMDVVVKNTELTYSIEEKTIVIKRKNPSFLEKIISKVNTIDVSGRVVDADGRGLPGASVLVKGKGGKAVSTGTNGSFYLKGVDEDAILVVSFIGYVSKEIKAAKELGDLVLKLSTSKLDEVQVIAYGTTTQRLSTGNVTTIKADAIEKQPVNNPLLALVARVPGLMITQATGLPGSGVTVRVQGQNSIANGNDPFFVIDGVPFPSQNLSGLGSILGESGGVSSGSPLSFINSSDIESIDVLKDADATAIYGSRAANGAILITTKKGKVGEASVDINIQSGIGQVAKKLNLLNTEQYLSMRNEAIKNAGLTTPTMPSPSYYDLTLFDQTRYTDWQEVFLGGTARYTDAQASVSGGNSNLQGLFGANYHKETSVFPGDFADYKGAIHISLSSISTNRKFQMQFSGNYLDDNNKLPQVDLTEAAIKTIPNAPPLYDSNGNLNWEMYNGSSSWRNPLIRTLQKYKNHSANLVSNLNLSYEILKGLQLKSSFGYNRKQSDEIAFTPQTYAPPEASYNARSSKYATSDVSSWIVEPQVNYELIKDFGKFNFLIGSTFQHSKSNLLALTGSGYTNDAQLENIRAASSLRIDNTIQSIYNYNAAFGRLNYNYRDKYLLNLSARRDGSSRFGSENLFNSFYSLAGAWIFTEEKWLKENLPILSYGKLRFSYGSSGNDQIGDYSFMSLYSPFTTDITYGGGTGLKPTGHSNPYLQWEETRKINLGFDLGFSNDRILLNCNYYRNRSSNQLLAEALSIITGFADVAQNFNAKVENRGYELLINSVNIKSGDFNWTSSLNFTANRNKLIEYKNLESSSYANSLVIGEPITIVKAFQFAGVNPETGLYQFRKADGSLTSAPSDPIDKYVIENRAPKYFGGVNNHIYYKGFGLDFLFQFAKQLGQDQARFGYSWPGYYANAQVNQPTSILNNWKRVNDISSTQKFTTDFEGADSFDFAANSDASYVDASFIRLKNLSLSWTLPKNALNKFLIKNARIYCQGQNLFTITKYKGLNPETADGNLNLPPLKVITLGVQLTL